jgi:hypothetical protein
MNKDIYVRSENYNARKFLYKIENFIKDRIFFLTPL